MSRSSLFKSFKSESRNSSAGSERFGDFLEEKAVLQEKLQDNLYDFMMESSADKLEFIKEAGRLSSDLPGRNREAFDKVLNFFWTEVYECVYSFEEVLDALCDAFPSYERLILKEAYLAFIDGEMRYDSDFVLLLERMADYDELDEANHFSTDLDLILPCSLEEPVINVYDRLDEIFASMYPFSPMADIISVLADRFGVDRETLERLAFDKLCTLYAVNTISDLIYNECLNELFKLPEGYDLFFVCTKHHGWV